MSAPTAYYEDIKDLSNVLSREEERALFLRYEQGDEAAGKKIVEANLRFVISVANQYTGSGLPLADLISEGNIGLMVALGHFDIHKGHKFISYAVWWIKQRIKAYIKEDHVVRRPGNIHDAAAATQKAQHTIAQRLDREATAEDLAEHLSIDPDKVVHALTCNHAAIRPEGDGLREIERMTGHVEEALAVKQIEDQERDDILRETIETVLTDREQYVIMRSFGFDGSNGMTLDKIGRSMGLTRERIRQIREMALLKLKTRPAVKRLKLS